MARNTSKRGKSSTNKSIVNCRSECLRKGRLSSVCNSYNPRELSSGFLESLRPISIGLPSNEAKAERPIEIGRRLKPAPQAHAVSRSVRKYIRQNVKLFLRQPLDG